MSGKQKVMLLGWINVGNTPQCGETVKNQHIIRRIEACGGDVITLDFFRWKRHPWVIAKFFASLMLYPRTPLILSTAPKNVYFMMKWHKWLHSSRRVVQWVIGGNLHKLIRNGEINPKYISSLHCNIVETQEMEQWMAEDGIDNVVQTPNFKPIPYKPELKPQAGRKRFVFISRIKPEKGVDYIFQAIEALNAKGLSDKYEVDFYGPIDKNYVPMFQSKLMGLPNVKYKGFLQVNSPEGYDTLASYTAMLFPTYWKSEGFAGIFIDAFIAGLPVIASDWAHNFHILEDGKTGIKIPVHDAQAIACAMEDCILGNVDIECMRRNCQLEADVYDAEKIITPAYLKKVGVLK